MRSVIRTREVQLEKSPGLLVAALVLIGLIALGWLAWWTLLLTLMIIPIINQLTLGRTTEKQITIDEDV